MKRTCILLLFLLLPLPLLRAQITVESRLDSMQLLVGEQTGLILELVCNTGQQVVFPPMQPGTQLVPNVELISSLPMDTLWLNEGKRMQLSQKYILTAWDSAFYYLPALSVKVDGEEYESKPLAIKVYTLDVDTLHFDRYFGPKAEMNPPFAWADWSLILWASLLLALLAFLFVWITLALKTGKPLIRVIRRKRKDPAHTVALSQIERIKQERSWAQEDSKQYYTQLTDTLRTYIQERYDFSAMEMTSQEIINRLMQENDEAELRELAHIFQTADLVKFAKYSTLINENDANLMTALRYVQQTKQEPDPNLKPEEIIVPPEAKRQRATRHTLGAAAVFTLVLSMGLLAWIIYRMTDLIN